MARVVNKKSNKIKSIEKPLNGKSLSNLIGQTALASSVGGFFLKEKKMEMRLYKCDCCNVREETKEDYSKEICFTSIIFANSSIYKKDLCEKCLTKLKKELEEVLNRY